MEKKSAYNYNYEHTKVNDWDLYIKCTAYWEGGIYTAAII